MNHFYLSSYGPWGVVRTTLQWPLAANWVPNTESFPTRGCCGVVVTILQDLSFWLIIQPLLITKHRHFCRQRLLQSSKNKRSHAILSEKQIYGIGWLVDQCFQYTEKLIFLHTHKKVWGKIRWVFYELLTAPWTCPWWPNKPKSYFHEKRLQQDFVRKNLALAAAISLLFQQRRWAATFTHEPRRQEAYYQTKQQVWLKNSKLFDHFRLNLNGVIFFSVYLSWDHVVFVLLPIFQPLTNSAGKKHTSKPSSRSDLKLKVIW